ncbi:hypothetical protein VTN49DRAFT_5775 [Thermomyces lanuginosus]|uniref:uncharacterized protein n=1 Tax=Thermomyces lanuginosus TaxID=5541 RepID=UPI00374369BE
MDYTVPNVLIEDFRTDGLLDITMDDLHVLQALSGENLVDEDVLQTLSTTGFAQVEPDGSIVKLDEGGDSSAGFSENNFILVGFTESSTTSGQTYSSPDPLHVSRVPDSHGQPVGGVGGGPQSDVPAGHVTASGAPAIGAPVSGASAGNVTAGGTPISSTPASVAPVNGTPTGSGSGSGNNMDSLARASNVCLPPLYEWYDATPEQIAQQYLRGVTPLYDILVTLGRHERDAVDATNRLVRLLDRRYQALCPPTHEKFNAHCFAVVWLQEYRKAKQLGSSDENINTTTNAIAGGGTNNDNTTAATVAVMSSMTNEDISSTPTAYSLSGQELGQYIRQQEELYCNKMDVDNDMEISQPPPVPQSAQPPRIPWSMIRGDIVLDREAYQNFLTMVYFFRYMYITITWKRWCTVRNDTEQAVMARRRYLPEPDMRKLRIWWQEFRRGCEDWERLVFDMRIPTFDEIVREVREMMADAIDFDA